jgi:hypothetical protein
MLLFIFLVSSILLFIFLQGSKEYQKKEEQVDRFTQDSMKRLCEILDLEKKGNKVSVMTFCMVLFGCISFSKKQYFLNSIIW